MLRLLITLLLSLLPLAVQAAEDKMLYVEYRLTGKKISAYSFDAQTKKVWRIGNQFLRFEDAPNPETKVHGLVIVAEPDIWIIDRKTNKGQHTVDPGPNYKIHFPLLASERSEKLRQLEFGGEMKFFNENFAKELPTQEIEGYKCKVFQFRVEDIEVTLFLKGDRTPLEIALKAPDYEYSVRFLRYEPDRKPDTTLFKVPAGVEFKK